MYSSDPLLYDRLIRRFQTADEREKEGRERGYTGSLEADLVRSEAKLEALRHPDPNSPVVYKRAGDGSIVGVEADEDERAHGREEGRERWVDVMSQRFLRGDDTEFDYSTVDDNEEYDDRGEEDRNQLEQYLGKEDEEFSSSTLLICSPPPMPVWKLDVSASGHDREPTSPWLGFLCLGTES
ncbi:hypothetical protein BAUCODRAFT_36280 [Baudoinia panamericana UAMH 10762]|uniref:CCD97-like C-terminal domain-containing protein n=1 Tax=Baudoinia panamericana (strain UAMH 10762) TaxID=717646 RepID=M2N471_BAUPA|nr:uncharacterized protein BAUCODRAFT_36280 [Baudoinia panamericana UAMH 10762]EMC93819.1 hypothetical protein BAUCODRAFT_36280 [Baudoinia panamericana UAMH 10762]